MHSYFDRLFALIGSKLRLRPAELRRRGAASHARSRSDALEAAPAGCTRPSEAALERFRPRIGASGASKTNAFLKKNNEFLLFAVSAAGVSSALRNAPRTTPGMARWCSQTATGVPRELPGAAPRRLSEPVRTLEAAQTRSGRLREAV